MIDEYVWVIGFDKETGAREKFICCHKNNSKFYEELYLGENYDMKVLTDKEVDVLIESENKNK